MANVITVKGGSSTPTTSNLEKLELGFDKVAKKLYIRCEDEIIQIGTSKEEIINTAFPIKSIFITTNSTNPGTYLGGTWEAFGTGKTLIAVDESNTNFSTVEKTGGSTSLNLAHTHITSGHTLTTSEMPSHSHSFGSHTHSMTHTHDDTFKVSSHSHTMNHGHSDTFSTSSAGAHTHDVRYKNQNLGLDNNGAEWGYVIRWEGMNKLPYDGSRFIAASAGSHSHTISGSVSNYSGSTGSASPSISGSVSQYSGSTGSASGTSDTAGSGNSHSHGNTGSALDSYTILPPYITVYMWKRIS